MDINTNETYFEIPSSDANSSEKQYDAQPTGDASNETFFEMPSANNNDSGETVFDPSAPTYMDESTNNFTDDIIGANIDGYIVMSVISDQGKESNVYLAEKAGEKYALKIYERSFEINRSKMELLKKISSPYVTNLVDYGTYNNHPYELYCYYQNGTLEEVLNNQGKIDDKHVKQYVKQLNEGLNALHNLNDNFTIIHGDLKPSNIFISNDRESVLIGDFGISSFLDGDEYSIGNACGTPEYAPPSYGVVNKVKKTKAYDYGSLGLVLFHMAVGYSYFRSLSTEEIAKEWEKGIEIPEYLDTRIKLLLKGLLEKEENVRFDYAKVNDWYDGSFVQVVKPRNVYANLDKKVAVSLWFGIVDGQIIEVSSIQELINQMKANWDLAVYKIHDDNFFSFLKECELDAEKFRTIVKESSDDAAAVFKILYTLSSDSDIVYKGKNFGKPESFVEKLNEGDLDAKEIVVSGLFDFYIERMGYGEDIILKVKDVLNDNVFSNEIKVLILSYMFSKDKNYNGISSINDLRESISNMQLEQIDKLASDDVFIAWSYCNGLTELSKKLVLNRG